MVKSSTTSSPKTSPDSMAAPEPSTLEGTNALLTQILMQQAKLLKLLEGIHELGRGFTADGTSFTAHRSDPMVVTYAALAGSLVARLISTEGITSPAQIAKAVAPLARELLLELDAYRTQAEAADYIDDQCALISR